MKQTKHLLAAAISLAITSPAAFATNGMNLEGYGPIATGMGGASMAYDNGTAAMMNNPATIGLAEEDGNRLDVAWGFLGPDVKSSAMGTTWDSKSNAFNMPAIGWTQKKDRLTIGAGAFAQGGMGTEYKATAPGAAFMFVPNGTHSMGGSFTTLTDASASTDAATIQGWEEMSEVGVMRVLVPVSYEVDNKLNIGGSIDFVRATMDLKMVMTGAMMADMMGAQTIGTMSPDATMGAVLNGIVMGGGDIYGGQMDFADSNPYGGATEGTGFAGKIGFTYKVNDMVTVGGSYHSETSLGDLSGNATFNLAVNDAGNSLGMGAGDHIVPISGKVKVKDFQWPATMALGVSVKATPQLMVVADVKQMNWSSVMKDFKMSFDAGAMGSLDMKMYQNWKDQTAFQLGASYQVNNEFVVRVGANVANNPIPNSTLHYLFPAIVENHYTAGFGYEVTPADDINFSLTYAPEVSTTNDMGLEIKHAQTNWQLMYSHSF